jgi:Right handed beta helix region
MNAARLLRAATASLAVIACGAALASAETVYCTAIEDVPITITEPGVYCLNHDLSFSSPSIAVIIEADGVTLDLNGHSLEGSGVGRAVYAIARNNITIRNGRISSLSSGVNLGAYSPTYAGSGGHLIEGLEFQGMRYTAVYVAGRGNVVRDNRILDTGNSDGNSARAIVARGPGARVLDNEVIGTRGGAAQYSAAAAIVLGSAPGSVVESNRITDTVNLNQGDVAGIWVSQSPSAQVNGNRIANTTGYPNSTGVLVVNSHYVAVRDNVFDLLDFGIVFGAGSSGKYMGNLASGVTVPYAGGTAAGTTNY